MSRYHEAVKVSVLYFGVLREGVGVERASVDLPEGMSTADLLASLRAGRKERVWDSLAIAVNREFAAPDRVLADGDEVALLPPVSGGAR